MNLRDAKIRGGEFKLILPYRLPLILGHDVAGMVAKVGPRVRQFKVGDEVYARPDDFRIGTFAEFVPVKERGGKLISISGPPDREFGKEVAAAEFVRLVMRLLTSGVRRKAKGLGIGYSFLFMKASGSQLREITRPGDADKVDGR